MLRKLLSQPNRFLKYGILFLRIVTICVKLNLQAQEHMKSFTSGSYQRRPAGSAAKGKVEPGHGLGAPGHEQALAALAPPFRGLPRSARPANLSGSAAEK